MNANIKIGDIVSEGFDLYKSNFGLLFGATLLAVLIGSVTCGICSAPLSGGVLIIADRLLAKSEPAPRIGDIFKGFDFFLPAFLSMLLLTLISFASCAILVLIPVIGMLLSFAVSLFMGPITTWVLLVIIHQKMSCMDAIGFVLKQSLNGAFMKPLLVLLLGSLISSAGMIACGVGIFFTMPILFTIAASAYRQVFPANAQA